LQIGEQYRVLVVLAVNCFLQCSQILITSMLELIM
jgi:hypothetical protein